MQWSTRLLINILLTHSLPLMIILAAIGISGIREYAVYAVAGGAALSVIFGILQWRQLHVSLQQLTSDARDTAEGNLKPHDSDKLPQPFGAIGESLNTTATKLQEFVNRTQAETEVITAEANRLRMVLNSIQDGVLALDRNKHIILFNQAASQITGLNIDQVAGQHINNVLPLTQHKSLVLSQWIDTCEGADMEQTSWEGVTLTRPDSGEDEDLLLNLEALYTGTDPNGIRTLVTFHNRTQEQQVEDMKVDFVALAAHELRTPVTVIRGYIEILENELEDQLDPQYQDFIHKLDTSATQLAGSINNILHVSRIEHGELNLNLETLQWEDIVHAVVEELSTKASTQGKSIQTDIPEELPAVSVDRVSITEVLTNLIDNGLKYSQKNQTVTVRTWHDSHEEVIKTAVTDEGIGMPANTIAKLFSKFYRSHRTRTSHRGTGLGLYMSKHIIEAHGGRIQVQSKEGEGSTFTFELPVAKASNEPDNEDIMRGVHGWIKNHSLYRG